MEQIYILILISHAVAFLAGSFFSLILNKFIDNNF